MTMTMQLRPRNSSKRKRSALSEVEFTPKADSLDWMERCQVRLRDAMLRNALQEAVGGDTSCTDRGIKRPKMDHVSKKPSCRTAMKAARWSGAVKMRVVPVPEPKKMVRFSALVTVRVPFVSEEEERDDETTNVSTWYGREDYSRFEMDCRRAIQAAIRSVPADSESKVVSEKDDALPLQGLEDFLSYEAKQLRSFRRVSHCYNVLYHQFMHRQHCNVDDEDDYDAMVSILQRISERSSRESLELALCRGKERACE